MEDCGARGELRGHRPPAGADPSTLAVEHRAGAGPLRLVRYDGASWEERVDASLESVGAALGGAGVLWIDVVDPDAAQLSALQRLLHLHPLAVADAAHPPQRPRYAPYASFELFVLAAAQEEEESPRQVSLFLGAGWVLTIREAGRDSFEPVLVRLREQVGVIRQRGGDYLAAALISTLVDGFFAPVEALRDEIEEAEDRLLGGGRQPIFRWLQDMRFRLLSLRRVLGPLHEAILRAGREESPRWDTDCLLHLRAAADDAAQLVEAVAAAQQSAATLGDLYLSVLGSRTNEVVTVLTLVSTIFLPMTFLTGVWGMNFFYMPELRWRSGYLFAWILILCSAGLLLLLFQRRGWLRTLRLPWLEEGEHRRDPIRRGRSRARRGPDQ